MKPSIFDQILSLFRTEREPMVQYYRLIEGGQITVDWEKRLLKIRGAKIIPASDEEAMWIKHFVRVNEERNTVRMIDE